jgi:hypothetical protein
MEGGAEFRRQHACRRRGLCRCCTQRIHPTAPDNDVEEPVMALPEELDQRLEERLSLVETPDYEGEQMTRQDYVSVLLLCALLPVVLLVVANVIL